MDYEKLIVYQADKIRNLEEELKRVRELLKTTQDLYFRKAIQTNPDIASDQGVVVCQTMDLN